MWPAIFLPLNTRPGSWRLPVEPWLRCETDTPCEARRPPKLCRFIDTGEALADRDAADVDELAGDEVADMDLGADLEQRVLVDPELADLRLGLDLGLGEVAAHRLGDVLGLARADAELDGAVAVLLRPCAPPPPRTARTCSTVTGHVAAVDRRTGGSCPSSGRSARYAAWPGPSELDLDVDAGGEVELHQRVHGLRRRVDDVEQPLVRADLELLAALLVDVRRAVAR